MFPLRDANPAGTTPAVTYGLIAVNVAVFAYEASLGHRVDRFIETWGMVPAAFTPVRLFTSMFLHGGLMHVLGNMWFLHIFGDNVEDRLGKRRYLFFYLAAGCAAGLAQLAIDPHSHVPVVGASGAIAGVTGAYLLLFPHAKVRTLLGLPPFLMWTTDVSAWVFLLIWFVMQIQGGCTSLHGAGPGVAFFAHIGGFVAGAAMAMVLAGPALTRDGDLGHRWT